MLVLKARSVLLLFALSRRLSRSRLMLCRVGYYIICTSHSVRLRRGCGLSLSMFLNLSCLVAGFCRVSSLAFFSTFVSTLYKFDSRHFSL